MLRQGRTPVRGTNKPFRCWEKMFDVAALIAGARAAPGMCDAMV